LRINREIVGGSLSTLAMFTASTGKIYIGGFLMAMGIAVLYKRKPKEKNVK